MRTKEQIKRDNFILNLIKFLSIIILASYCIWNDFLLDYIGGIPCIIAITFMLIKRNWINKLLDDDN